MQCGFNIYLFYFYCGLVGAGLGMLLSSNEPFMALIFLGAAFTMAIDSWHNPKLDEVMRDYKRRRGDTRHRRLSQKWREFSKKYHIS